MDLKKIGHTPIKKLTIIPTKYRCFANIYAKLESYNVAGSMKDRVALKMIEDIEEKELLKQNSAIIEPTSGNTRIGIAMEAQREENKGRNIVVLFPDGNDCYRSTKLFE